MRLRGGGGRTETADRRQRDGVFIDVDVDDSIAGDVELAKKLEEVCPVDIFKAGDRVSIVQENVDECVLCRLCMDAAPAGSVRVLKLYDNESILGASG